MGLRYVKGLGEQHRARLEAMSGRTFTLAGYAREARLDVRALGSLAESGAFESLGLSRRASLWEALGEREPEGGRLGLSGPQPPEFDALDPLETIKWDYRTTSHSVRGHPLGPMRSELAGQGLPDASTVSRMADGDRVRFAGLVICRQRPGTASGVTFMTLEDETGFVNLVVWTRVFEKYAVVAKTAPFLGATGRLQVEQGVVHLVADTLWVPEVKMAPPTGGSRDFH